MDWITGAFQSFFKWLIILGGIALIPVVLVATDILPGGDTVKVLYLDGQRVCDSGYDYKTPRCRFVYQHEWAGHKWDMRWALLDKDTGDFIRYDGWFVARSEIDAAMEAGYSDIIANPYLESALREYGTWAAVDWEQALCYAEVVGTFEPTEHCENLYHGRELSYRQMDHNARIENRQTFAKILGIIVVFLSLLMYSVIMGERVVRRLIWRTNP